MLIQALNDYYGILAKQGKVLKEGYSNEKAHYYIELSEDGKLAKITDCKIKQEILQKNGKIKEFYNPREVVLPKRTEKPGIDGNIVEHRPLYIFGLNSDKQNYSFADKTDKAKKSHADFAKKNLAFIEGLDSPVVNAYRQFIENWKAEEEMENPYLLTIVKEYPTAKFVFCLEGRPDILLHEDEKLLEKWESVFSQKQASEVVSQCAITGENLGIARIHDKIRGVAGANATGAGIIVFNNPSDNSYGNEQSYNSNISEYAMKRYTEALNYLLSSRKHKTVIDDLTVVHFAMSLDDRNHDAVSEMVFERFTLDEISDKMDAIETEKFLGDIATDAKEGALTQKRAAGAEMIDKDVDFYMLGLKPNSSRLSVKFVYRQKIGKILENMAAHQRDLKIDEKSKAIPFWQLKEELVSPKSSKDTINTAMSAKIWNAMLYGTNYPEVLLRTVINRVKVDADTETDKFVKINHKRVGMLKACINRSLRNAGKEEEITMGLNVENKNQAYLCGRLFAVYEKIQQESANETLNRTIKDSYFSVACGKPASVFPKIAKLSHFHLKKIKSDGRRINFEKLIGEISASLEGGYPSILPPVEQGKFIVGYYQQNKDLYTSKQNKEEQ